MRVNYQKNDKTWSYLHYNQFSVGSASEEYPLTVGGFTGQDTDRFAYQNGMKLSTPNNRIAQGPTRVGGGMATDTAITSTSIDNHLLHIRYKNP